MTEEEARLEEECASLVKRNNELMEELKKLHIVNDALKEIKKRNFDKFLHETPVFVWHTKKRNNTTIKFADGSTSTVHKAKGETDDLEIAIVYAIIKHKYGKKLIANLIKNTKEVK